MRVNFPFPSPESVPELKGVVTFAGGRPGRRVIRAWAIDAAIPSKQYFARFAQAAPGQRALTINFGHVPPGNYYLRFDGDDVEAKEVDHIKVPGALPPITLNIIGVAVMTGAC